MERMSDALAVVLGQQRNEELVKLRSENAKLKEALCDVSARANTKSEYYFQLVWLAREQEGDDDRLSNVSLQKTISDMGCQSEFAVDVDKLRGECGDWYHGFNSGVLAASRLFNELASATHDIIIDYGEGEEPYTVEQQRENALEEFPMLDT